MSSFPVLWITCIDFTAVVCLPLVSATAFYKAQPVIEFMCEVLDIRNIDEQPKTLTDSQRVRFTKEIKGGLLLSGSVHSKNTMKTPQCHPKLILDLQYEAEDDRKISNWFCDCGALFKNMFKLLCSYLPCLLFWFVLKRPEGGGDALWPNEEKVSRMQCHPTSCQPPNVSRKLICCIWLVDVSVPYSQMLLLLSLSFNLGCFDT